MPESSEATADHAPTPGASRLGRGMHLVRRLGPIGPMAMAATALPPLGGLVLLGSSVAFTDWFRPDSLLGVTLFVASLSVLGGLALLPTYALSVVSGIVFGVAMGLPAAVLAFLGAAVINYALVTRWAGDRATKVVEDHPRARAVHRALMGGGFWRCVLVVALIRLPPNAPFALTNVVLSSLRMPMGRFLLGTAVGMSPRVGAAVLLGATLGDLEQARQANPWLLAAGLTTLVAVLIALGQLAKRALGSMQGGEPEMDAEGQG